MNKNYYWDEYIKFYINNEIKECINKFYISNNTLISEDNTKLSSEYYNIITDKIKSTLFSDIIIKEYNFKTLQKDLLDFIHYLKSLFFSYEKIITLPVISIYNYGIENGHYTIDFINERIILYKLNEFKNEFKQIYLNLFLILDYALVCYNSLAYEKGLMQIGYISHSVINYLKSKNFEIRKINYNKMNWSYKLDINIKKSLLIDILEIKEK